MHINQLRAERANLQRLTTGAQFAEPLTATETAAIHGLWRTAEHIASNARIVWDGKVRLVTSGWAGWLRSTGDGRRLIFLFLIPGDFIVPSLFDVHDCELISLTPMRTVDASSLDQRASTASPQSRETIKYSGLRYRRLLLDHMTRLMMGSTTASVAMLLGEFHQRSIRSGACVDGRFSLPIGQRTLAAALGRSPVQINKVMSQFQADGLIRVGYDWLEVIDPEKLRAQSDFAARQPALVAAPLPPPLIVEHVPMSNSHA